MSDKIASVKPFIVPVDSRPADWWTGKLYVLVRVETTDGIVGWGEAHTAGFRHDALAAMIHAAGEWLLGRPAGDIHRVQDDAFNAFGNQRAGFEVHSAFAGIEIALWDILGKRLGAPIHALLGGSHHDVIPVYGNTYSPLRQPAEAVADMSAALVARGYKAVKVYPFLNGRAVDEGLALLAAVRDAVGPDIGIAADLWRQADPREAEALARAMAPFDLMWLEDPMPPTDAAVMRRLRDAIPQPLMTGETVATRHEMFPLIEHRAVDLINAEICLSGLLETRAIATLADAGSIKISPHNSNTMALGTTAAVHAAAGIRNLAPLECFPVFETALDDLFDGRLAVSEGAIALPTKPGLGIDVDETAIARFRV
jgi:galactonate dehydratase